jgi:hypothetical protein
MKENLYSNLKKLKMSSHGGVLAKTFLTAINNNNTL